MWLFRIDGEQGVDMTNARPNGQDSSWLKLLWSGPQPSQGPVVLTSLLSTKFLLRTEINRFVFHVLPPLGDEFIGRDMSGRRLGSLIEHLWFNTSFVRAPEKPKTLSGWWQERKSRPRSKAPLHSPRQFTLCGRRMQIPSTGDQPKPEHLSDRLYQA